MTAKKKKKGGGIFWKLLFLVALCVFCFSMYQLVNIYLGYKKGVDEYHAVAEATTVQSSEPLEVVEEKKDEEGNLIPEEELTVNPPEVDFDALKAINDDVVGWLELEAIPSISYPIAQGEDNEYYLHRTIKKTYNFAGSVFIDSTNASDFSDCNTIIYGHNMKNGSIFGTLQYYLDKSYYEKHKTMSFDTLYKRYDYQIVAVGLSKITDESADTFKYYDFLNAASEKEFDNFKEKIKSLEVYDTGVKMKYGDKLITLSTCNSVEKNGRLFVIAKRN